MRLTDDAEIDHQPPVEPGDAFRRRQPEIDIRQIAEANVSGQPQRLQLLRFSHRGVGADQNLHLARLETSHRHVELRGAEDVGNLSD